MRERKKAISSTSTFFFSTWTDSSPLPSPDTPLFLNRATGSSICVLRTLSRIRHAFAKIAQSPWWGFSDTPASRFSLSLSLPVTSRQFSRFFRFIDVSRYCATFSRHVRANEATSLWRVALLFIERKHSARSWHRTVLSLWLQRTSPWFTVLWVSPSDLRHWIPRWLHLIVTREKFTVSSFPLFNETVLIKEIENFYILIREIENFYIQ